jgi:hypothetical protein
MLKKIGLPLLTLAAMLIVMPAPQAKAGVRFGVYLGGPAYVAPAPVYPYPAPGYYNAYSGYYNAYPAYPYVAPGYVYPYNTWRGHDYRGYGNYEGRGHEWRGHAGYESRGRGRR